MWETSDVKQKITDTATTNEALLQQTRRGMDYRRDVLCATTGAYVDMSCSRDAKTMPTYQFLIISTYLSVGRTFSFVVIF